MSSKENEENATITTSTKKNDHSAQWERQGEWLTKLRNYKQYLEQEQGLQGWDLLEAMATLSLNHKISILQDTRCPNCWHDPNYCICSQLKPIETTKLTTNLLIYILMHHKEYLGAGNSAKLLLQLLPNHTQLYLFGKQGELSRLQADLAGKPTMILWPSETAVSVQDYKSQLSSNPQKENQPVYAIALDGTYTQARNMYKSLRKQWKEHLPQAVAVNPTTASVFHRAQKNYGQAQLQQANQVLRVSTAEACGILWTEWKNESKDASANAFVLDAIVQAVVANNDALAFARNR